MKSYIKYIAVTVVVLAIVAVVFINSKKDKNYANNDLTTVETTTTEGATTVDNKEKESDTEQIDRETIYHENVGIDQLIDDYNKIAKIKITPDMVSKGSYSINANITVNDVSIIIFNTESSMSIDYSYEGKSDDAIYPLFRDFSKVLKNKLTNKKIKKAWNEIKEGDYKNNSFYSLKGIEVTYITGEADEKNTHYLIRTKLNMKE